MARVSQGDHTVLPATHTRTIPCLYSPAATARRRRPMAGTHCAYPRKDGQAELDGSFLV